MKRFPPKAKLGDLIGQGSRDRCRKLVTLLAALSFVGGQPIKFITHAAAEDRLPVRSWQDVPSQRLPQKSSPTRLPLVSPMAEPHFAPLTAQTPYVVAPFYRSLEQSCRHVAPSSVTTTDGHDTAELLAPKFPWPVTLHDRREFEQSIENHLRGVHGRHPFESLGNFAQTRAEFDFELFDRSLRASLVASSQPAASSEQDLANDLGGPFTSGVIDPSCLTPSPFDNDFSPTPIPSEAMIHDGDREAWVYDSKRAVPVQHPWVEWGRIWYGDGITPRGRNWFGEKNLVRPKFYVYGDYRAGMLSGRNAGGRTDNWAQRLNLDLDLQLTDTERFHAFVGPLDRDGRFSRWELVDGKMNYESEIDLTPVTGFFEGDLGVLLGTLQNRTSPMEIPFTIGLVPLLFQNGIWMEDAVTGAAFAIPARHSRLFKWSNFDATFFAAVDQINSPAFGSDEHAARLLGTAWFIEAYGGYIETGYAYLYDRNNNARSYHNITASFTRRYLDRISNSVRVIVNTGQDLAADQRTADGGLLLFENSWITASPLTVVPYVNLFFGWDRPQSVARAGVSGGILRNTGINFDTDGLNGFATLDASASDTAGGSIGIDLIGDNLDRQLLVEATYLTPHGSKNPNVLGDQFAIGSRYQFPISHRSLLRFDAMYGWRGGLDDVYGTRMEYRWKF